MTFGVPTGGRNLNSRRLTMRNFAGDPFGRTPAILPTPPRAAQPDFMQVLTSVAPIARELLDDTATEDVEVLRAKIANHRNMRDSLPEPFKGMYANKVRVLEARLRAAQQAKALELEEQESTRTWRLLGYSVTGTGIMVGGAAILILLAGTRHLNRKAAK